MLTFIKRKIYFIKFAINFAKKNALTKINQFK